MIKYFETKNVKIHINEWIGRWVYPLPKSPKTMGFLMGCFNLFVLVSCWFLTNKLNKSIVTCAADFKAWFGEILPFVQISKKSLEQKDNFALYSGDDPTATEFMINGGMGTISVTSNIVPKTISNICDYALNGEAKAARDLDTTLVRLNQILFIESNPIPVKWMLNRIGRITDGIRLPLSPLDTKFHDKAEEVLAELNLLN